MFRPFALLFVLLALLLPSCMMGSQLEVPSPTINGGNSIPERRVVAVEWPTLSDLPKTVKADGGKDAALIIGIEDYAFVSDVRGARQNAKDWYSYLVESRKIPGGNIKLLRDKLGSLESIKKYAGEAALKVKRGGTLWIIYIGHGAPSEDGKDGILVGVDSQQTPESLYARSLGQKELIQIVSKGKQAHTMMIIDACFSGKNTAGEMLAKDLQPLLLAKETHADVTILSAGKGNEFAGPLPGMARPAFSYLILGAMRGWGDENSDGDITAVEATNYARNVIGRVVEGRTQTPQLRGPDGDFKLSRGVKESGPNITAMVLDGAGTTRPIERNTGTSGTVTTPKPVPEGGQLEIMGVSPSSVTVLVNGYEMGIAPNQFLDLPLGKVKVTLRAPGYQDYTTSIQLKRGKLAELNSIRLEALPAILAVTANISGAQIKVNGRVVGTTVGGRVVELKVPPGNASVKIERNGYVSYSERSTFSPGGRLSIKTDLKMGSSAPEGMVEVPAGKFTMGSNEEGDEKPIHQVHVDAFAIDRTEVTVGEYRLCVRTGKCTAPSMTSKYCSGDYLESNNWEKSGREDHPVNCVDWDQSVSYCAWKEKRLPTEAEWEKAARGTSGQKYPWGSASASCSKAVMDDGGKGCGRKSTWAVGSKPSGASPYGAQDMAGNVWEWTADWYDNSYYSSSLSRNPSGPSSGSNRVLRGGSWGNGGDYSRASSRDDSIPSNRGNYLGFRCVSPL